MAELHKVVITKSLGGRASKNLFHNDYHILTGAAIDSAEMEAIMTQLKDAEKSVMLDHVHFLRAHVKKDSARGASGSTNRFQTLYFKDTGSRASGGGARAEMTDVIIIKLQPREGRAGQIMLRGALLASEIQVSEDGNLELVAGAAVGGAPGIPACVPLYNALCGDDGTLMLPNPKNYGLQVPRHVQRAEFNGLGTLQVTRRRKTAAAALHSAEIRRLHEIQRSVTKALGGVAPGAATGVGNAVLQAALIEAGPLFNALSLPQKAVFAGEEIGGFFHFLASHL
jgi:hypothetical protein